MVALVAALFGCIQAGQGIGANTADALFFLRFGVNYLPYMFMGLGGLTFFASLLYATGLGRFDKGRYFVAILGAGAIVVFVERAAILLDVSALYPILWLSINLLSAILGIFTWNAAGQVCDARQAKRLFSLFASAGILGGVVGNLITGALAKTFGTENLLLLYGALLLMAAAVMRLIAREHMRREAKREVGDAWQDLRVGFDVMRGSRLMQIIVIASVLFSVLFFSLSFPFSQVVSASFPSEADVAGFLGLFSSVATAITFVVSLFLANRLYARLGVANAVLLLPIAYLGGFLLWAVNFNLLTAALVRLAQMVVLGGIASTAWNAFYNVLPSDKRGQAQAFESGLPSQIGVVLSGGLLILGERVLSTTQIFGLGIVTALVCGILVWQMRGQYGKELVTALRAGLIDVFTPVPQRLQTLGADATARHTAIAGLEDGKPTIRRTSAEILGKLGAREAIAPLIHALDDADAEVRRAALGALAALDAQNAVEPIAARLQDPDASVRGSAVSTLAILAPQASARWSSAVRDPEPTVRARAAVALCRTGQADAAHATIGELLACAEPPSRIQGLEALAECRDGFGPDQLVPFVRDENVGVRAAAAHALGRHDDAVSQTALVATLDDPDERVRTTAALALRGMSHSLDLVTGVLNRGSDRAQDAALDALDGHSAAARQTIVLWALTRIPEASDLRAAAAALAPLPRLESRALDFLRDLLREREWQVERRVLNALGHIGTAESIRVISEGLQARNPETRAQALEALDTLGDKRIARALLPLLEDTLSSHPGDARAVLQKLTGHTDAWLRALSVYAIGEMMARDWQTLMRRAYEDPAPIVRQTATAAMGEAGAKMAETVKTLGTMERILFLRQVPIFGNLAPEDLEPIANLATERIFAPGDYICREGEVGDELFVIVEGQVRVARQTNGDVHTLRMLQVGEQIGELAILREQPRSASVIAEGTTVRTLVLRGDALCAILRDRPQVALAMLAVLAQRLSTA